MEWLAGRGDGRRGVRTQAAQAVRPRALGHSGRGCRISTRYASTALAPSDWSSIAVAVLQTLYGQ